MVNKVILVARLGEDPIRKEFGSTILCEMRVCTEKSRGSNKTTEWFTIKAFGELAKPCLDFLKKGRMVFILGEFQSRKVNEKTYYDIVASEIQFL